MDDNTSFVLFFAAIFAFIIINNWVKSRKYKAKDLAKVNKDIKRIVDHLKIKDDRPFCFMSKCKWHERPDRCDIGPEALYPEDCPHF